MLTRMKAIILFAMLLTASTYGQRTCRCPPGPTVCGSDYKNYSGECNLNCEASLSGKSIYVIYNGPCENLYPKPNPYNPPNPYGTCDPCGIFSRYQPYNPYNPPYNPYNPPYNPYDPFGPFGSGKKAEN